MAPTGIAHELHITVQIGKKGLTEETLLEIEHQLKKRKTIKVKFLRSILESHAKQELIQAITDATGSELMMKAGSIIVLKKREKSK
jgi:RNA-binding protein